MTENHQKKKISTVRTVDRRVGEHSTSTLMLRIGRKNKNKKRTGFVLKVYRNQCDHKSLDDQFQPITKYVETLFLARGDNPAGNIIWDNLLYISPNGIDG